MQVMAVAHGQTQLQEVHLASAKVADLILQVSNTKTEKLLRLKDQVQVA